MPKTSVHEYDFSPGNKDKIRLAGQVFAMKPETEAKTVGKLPDYQFRFGRF